MANLDDLVEIHENALEENICQFLISIFDQLPDKHERHDHDGKPNFTQFNLTENSKLTPEVDQVHNHLIRKTMEFRDRYYEMIDSRCFPPEHAFEQYRIKKYNNDGIDQFNTHVDVMDYESSRRFLSFFWYLNDVEVGGETRFSNFSIKPKMGTLVIFPPLWMFPHKGEPPISGPKYLLSTYLHYK
jgi:prolyl 4-hydroxylase